MKNILIGIVAFGIGYWFSSFKGTSYEVTYSDLGVKTVVSICDKEKNCIISIGQQCEDTGYKVVSTDHDDMKTIVTAECGKKKSLLLLSFGN